MKDTKISRRQFVKTTALGTAAIAGAPYIKHANSAGSLSIGLWDHWVPGANDVSQKLIMQWGEENNVDITLDYITSIGFKQLLTIAAEARAQTGHDIMDLPTWETMKYAESFEPMDDVVNDLKSEHGELTADAYYLGQIDGTWRSVPGPIGSHTYPMVSRVDLYQRHAGINLKEVFPASDNRDPDLVDAWNYENFLEYTTKLNAAGHPFGNPIGPTSDSQDWIGPLFLSFGSVMVNENGDITADSDETRAALEYMTRLTEQMPPDVYAWDDAGNNRWIISGRGSSIQNPPSAWNVAKRDQPEIAAQLWHHDTPRGPAGRFRGSLPRMMGMWQFAQNKGAGKDLIRWLTDWPQQRQLITASGAYDLPLVKSYYRHSIWEEIGPPKGGQYNYPGRGDETFIVTGYPAPPAIAANIYAQGLIPTMVARVTQGGESFDDAIAWATNELEGYMRGI